MDTAHFVGELHRRRVKKSEFAAAHGISKQDLSVMLRCPALPDEFQQTLDRIAPMPEAEVH